MFLEDGSVKSIATGTGTETVGGLLQQLVNVSRPTSRSGKREESLVQDQRFRDPNHQDASKTSTTALTTIGEQAGGGGGGGENDKQTKQSKSNRRSVPILTGVCKLGDMMVIEEPKEYHILVHNKPTSTVTAATTGVSIPSTVYELGPGDNRGGLEVCGPSPSLGMSVVHTGSFIFDPRAGQDNDNNVDTAPTTARGVRCTYRAVSNGQHTQVS